MNRKQADAIITDLDSKMVFIVGPRQVGKTWLAKKIGESFEKTVYLNYDHFEDRQVIEDASWLPGTELLILDELHKMPEWKNFLKGVFDTKADTLKILVTGSARLDTWRQAGDSLAGRAFTHRLLPFSPAELSESSYADDMDRLLERGGFPEPFLAEDPVLHKRWRMQYIDGLVQTDVLDFEQIHDFKAMQTTVELLRRSVGSTVSFASLTRDIGTSPNTVKKYIGILEALFIVFRITPWSKNIARSLLKEPKIYFYDTGLVNGEPGAVFENFMAVNLYKHTCARRDYGGVDSALNYIRTKDGREVDFCLVEDGEPVHMIEAKMSNATPAKSLVWISDQFSVPCSQVLRQCRLEKTSGSIQVRDALAFCRELSL
jgi:predicted AAA+ superfamily ATPase